MAQKIKDANVLYLSKQDVLLSSWKNIHDIKHTDFPLEIQEEIIKHDIVIFSTAGVIPKLLKSRW